MKTLLLIDSHSLIHRAFHALPPLTSPKGEPAQALYGLSSILLKIQKEDAPDYMVALFDRPEPTFRKEKYDAYKAQRPKAADELVSQLIEARNLFTAFGVKVFECAGFEADDLIATFAARFRKEKNLRIMVLTGDLDTLQIVEKDKVVIKVLRRGVTETVTYNEAAVKERYSGLGPDQMIDYKSLVGDTSDNVKGVPGIGEKTAIDLLTRYGSLEKILKSKDEKDKKAQLVKAHKEEALLSQELVRLREDVPIKMPTLEELHNHTGMAKAKEYFQKFGFGSLLRRLENGEVKKEDKKEPKKAVSQMATLFSEPHVPSRVASSEEAIYFFSPDSTATLKELRSSKEKIGFDLKYVIEKIRHTGGEIRPPFFDLGVAFWLTDPDRKAYDVESFFQVFLKKPFQHTEAELARAKEVVQRKLEKEGLLYVFSEIEMPVLDILADMERWGIQVNKKTLAEIEAEMNRSIVALEKKIYAQAGQEFNINSSGQLAEILFDTLHLTLPRAMKTPGGARSTRAEVLEQLKDSHPVVSLILEYRELFKLKTTYASALQEHIHSDGRLHAEFIQTGTATGRLSSASPNLQNIPRESDWSPKIRSAFEASAGYSLVAFDYSQIELRLLASVSGDKGLIQAFQEGQDIHALTASKIFGVSPEAVRPEMRRTAKVLNFGLIYGMGARAFAKTSGFSQTESAQFIKTYYEEFPKVREFQERVKEEARTFGFVKTLTGRRRYFPDILSAAPQFMAAAEREAMNHPLQGLDADINKLAMIRVAEWLKKEGHWGTTVRLLITIHDELLFEVQDKVSERVIPQIQELMQGAYSLPVPLLVQISQGKNWGSLRGYLSAE